MLHSLSLLDASPRPPFHSSGSYPDPFHLVEGDLVQAAVVEAGGARAFVVGHLLGDFELAAVAQVFGDADSGGALSGYTLAAAAESMGRGGGNLLTGSAGAEPL